METLGGLVTVEVGALVQARLEREAIGATKAKP
jgi:hypothetical protein